jgi:hypothetical protein
MMDDRGYHVSSVIKLFLTLGCQVLGTHSEHAGKWPYCSGENPKSWQTNVSTDGARTVLYSTSKINNVQYVALCYRNGDKGVVMLHTTLEYAGVWDLLQSRSSRLSTNIAYKSTTAEMVYLRWLSSIIVFVAYQGCAPCVPKIGDGLVSQTN